MNATRELLLVKDEWIDVASCSPDNKRAYSESLKAVAGFLGVVPRSTSTGIVLSTQLRCGRSLAPRVSIL